ncbi:phage Gp37/Gp68 family protein [Hydrogenophaga sp.]
MSANSKIEWTDHTFNPWIGCTKVSPACDNCYAEVSTPSRTLGVTWGAGQERRRTSGANWALPVRWNAQAEAFYAQHGRRQRVFCASLADVFDKEVPAAWRADLFALIYKTPYLDWLLLTKRIGNVPAMTADAQLAMESTTSLVALVPSLDSLPPNVWLGATVTSQAEADRDIPKLLRVAAAKRFLSIEPLLGPVDLRSLPCGEGEVDALKPDTWEDAIEQWRDTDESWIEQFEDWYSVSLSDGLTGPMHSGIDWVIVGGESGHQARPMHPDWARGLRDQCAAAGVPFLFKQWGEWAPVGTSPVHPESTRIPGNLCRVTLDGITADHYVAISTDGGRERYEIRRVGKKAAGRLLDGVQHDGYPA